MATINNEKRLDLVQDSLSRINSWIAHADSKVGILLLSQAGLVAFVGTTKTDDIKKIINSSKTLDLNHFILYFSAVMFTFLIGRAAFYCYKALYPDTKARGGSLFFFGSIVNLGEKKFTEEFKKSKTEELEEDLLGQIFINSEIANQKFQSIKRSTIDTFSSFIFWIIMLLMISILKP